MMTAKQINVLGQFRAGTAGLPSRYPLNAGSGTIRDSLTKGGLCFGNTCGFYACQGALGAARRPPALWATA